MMTPERLDQIRDRLDQAFPSAPAVLDDACALLAEVDRLTDELESERGHAHRYADRAVQLMQECDEARSERDEALRGLRTVVRNPDVAADDHTTLPRLRELAGLDPDGRPQEDQ